MLALFSSYFALYRLAGVRGRGAGAVRTDGPTRCGAAGSGGGDSARSRAPPYLLAEARVFFSFPRGGLQALARNFQDWPLSEPRPTGGMKYKTFFT